MMKEILWIILLTLFAFMLRFVDSERPLWIDEAKYANDLVSGDHFEYRELIPVFISKLTNPTTERGLRFPFIVFSTLCIPAMWFVIEDKKKAWIIMITITFAPIYIFWGSMARPYTVALFFVVLGWRWPIFYVFGVVTTPYALVGINILKIKKRFLFYILLVLSSYIYYKSMNLSNLDHFNTEFLLNAKRLWIIPLCSFMLHSVSIDLGKLFGICKNYIKLAWDKV